MSISSPRHFDTTLRPGRTVVCVRNDTLREVLAESLTTEGLGPIQSVDGAEALEAWSALHPQEATEAVAVLVLDIDPRAGGSLQQCRDLRQRYPAAVIVALASSARAEDRVAALDAGADQLLAKPVSAGELLADIRRIRARDRAAPTSVVAAPAGVAGHP